MGINFCKEMFQKGNILMRIWMDKVFEIIIHIMIIEKYNFFSNILFYFLLLLVYYFFFYF